MSNIWTTLFRATLLVIVSPGTLSNLGAQEKRDLPVRNEIHRQYQLAPNTTVEISMIVGKHEFTAGCGNVIVGPRAVYGNQTDGRTWRALEQYCGEGSSWLCPIISTHNSSQTA